MAESHYVDGAVFRRNVAHKAMAGASVESCPCPCLWIDPCVIYLSGVVT